MCYILLNCLMADQMLLPNRLFKGNLSASYQSSRQIRGNSNSIDNVSEKVLVSSFGLDIFFSIWKMSTHMGSVYLTEFNYFKAIILKLRYRSPNKKIKIIQQYSNYLWNACKPNRVGLYKLCKNAEFCIFYNSPYNPTNFVYFCAHEYFPQSFNPLIFFRHLFSVFNSKS